MADRRQELIEAGLGRAAEVVGDITQPAIKRFYARFPMRGPALPIIRRTIRPVLTRKWWVTRSTT